MPKQRLAYRLPQHLWFFSAPLTLPSTLNFSSSWAFLPPASNSYKTLLFQPWVLSYTLAWSPLPVYSFPLLILMTCLVCWSSFSLSSGLFQMPLAVVSLISTIKPSPQPYLGATIFWLFTVHSLISLTRVFLITQIPFTTSHILHKKSALSSRTLDMSHILFLPSQCIVTPPTCPLPTEWVSSADLCPECAGSGNLCTLKGLIRSHRKCWVSCLLLLKCRSALLHNSLCGKTVCILFYCKKKSSVSLQQCYLLYPF